MTKPRLLTRRQGEWLSERAQEIFGGVVFNDMFPSLQMRGAYERAIAELTAKPDDVAALDKEMLELAWDLAMHAPLATATSEHAVDTLLRLDADEEWREHPELMLAVKYAGRYVPKRGEESDEAC